MRSTSWCRRDVVHQLLQLRLTVITLSFRLNRFFSFSFDFKYAHLRKITVRYLGLFLSRHAFYDTCLPTFTSRLIFTRPTTMHFVLSLFILQPSLKLPKYTNNTCWQPFRFVYLFSHRVCYFIFPVLHHGLLSKDLVTKDAYWRIVLPICVQVIFSVQLNLRSVGAAIYITMFYQTCIKEWTLTSLRMLLVGMTWTHLSLGNRRSYVLVTHLVVITGYTMYMVVVCVVVCVVVVFGVVVFVTFVQFSYTYNKKGFNFEAH